MFPFICIAAATVATARPQISVTSAAFASGAAIPDKYTCSGANVSPPLQISGLPAQAKSVALIVDDPDAPGGTFTHWLVWKIDPKSSQIAEGSAPRGAAQGTNDFGKLGYGGPCPPTGTHRYLFRVLALDTTIDVKSGAKRGELEKKIAGHVIARGELMGRYAKK